MIKELCNKMNSNRKRCIIVIFINDWKSKGIIVYLNGKLILAKRGVSIGYRGLYRIIKGIFAKKYFTLLQNRRLGMLFGTRT